MLIHIPGYVLTYRETRIPSETVNLPEAGYLSYVAGVCVCSNQNKNIVIVCVSQSYE